MKLRHCTPCSRCCLPRCAVAGRAGLAGSLSRLRPAGRGSSSGLPGRRSAGATSCQHRHAELVRAGRSETHRRSASVAGRQLLRLPHPGAGRRAVVAFDAALTPACMACRSSRFALPGQIDSGSFRPVGRMVERRSAVGGTFLQAADVAGVAFSLEVAALPRAAAAACRCWRGPASIVGVPAPSQGRPQFGLGLALTARGTQVPRNGRAVGPAGRSACRHIRWAAPAAARVRTGAHRPGRG